MQANTRFAGYGLASIAVVLLVAAISLVLFPWHSTAHAEEPPSPKGTLIVKTADGDILTEFEAYIDDDGLMAVDAASATNNAASDEPIIVNEISDVAVAGNTRVATFDVSMDINAVAQTDTSQMSVTNANWINYWIRAFYTISDDEQYIDITRVVCQFMPVTMDFFRFEETRLAAGSGNDTWEYEPGGFQFGDIYMDQYPNLGWLVWYSEYSNVIPGAWAETVCLDPPTFINGVTLTIGVNCGKPY